METVRIKQCQHGLMCFFPHDVYIGKMLDEYGVYNEEELNVLKQLVRPGGVVVEIGANIGCHTVPLAKHVGDAGRVIALEPQRIIYQMLCANLSINAIWNVEAYQRGMGAIKSAMGVPAIDYSRPGNFGGVSLQSQSPELCLVVTLDGMDLPWIDLLKIDVEGMEYDVLLGGTGTINSLRPVIYLENDRKSKSKHLIEKLFEFNYDLWWHIPKMMDGTAAVNMVGFPAERKIQVTDLKKIESSDDLAPGVMYWADGEAA